MFKVVTREKPTAEQIEDAIFAWKVVKHAKTNSVVIARDFKSVAIAQGQTNALSAVEWALIMLVMVQKKLYWLRILFCRRRIAFILQFKEE